MHPLRALFDHEAWANDQLLRRCAELPPEVLARETPGTRGTIPGTMTHLVGTGQFLRVPLTGRQEANAILAGQEYSVSALVPLARDDASGWRTLLAESPDPDGSTGPEMSGVSRWVYVVQYLHHGETHRAEVGTALGAAGVQPPRIDGWAFGSLDPAAVGSAGDWGDALLMRCFDHVGWATHQMLEHCLDLGEMALAAAAAGTYGTVHETLIHLIDSHAGYLQWLLQVEEVELAGGAEPDVVRQWLERARRDWRAYLEAGPDHERSVPTRSRPAPAWVLTMQAVHHASEHLAHAGTILGANGLPVPDVDVWAYHTALAESSGDSNAPDTHSNSNSRTSTSRHEPGVG
jgi:uncharacterized damage-inducible protein DinB